MHNHTRRYNGAIFLGLQGPVVKSHGSTDSFGFAHSINVCNKIVKADKNVRPWHLLDSIGKKDCRASIEYFESLQSGGYTIVLLLINLYNFFNTILLYHSNPKSNIYGLNKIVSSNLPIYVQNYKKNEIMNIIVDLKNLDSL